MLPFKHDSKGSTNQLLWKNGNTVAGNAAARLMEEEETMTLFGPADCGEEDSVVVRSRSSRSRVVP